MHKEIRRAILRRQTSWTMAATATPSDNARKRFADEAGLMSVLWSGPQDDPEALLELLPSYVAWLTEMEARLVAKEASAREIPPHVPVHMGKRQLAWSYYAALAEAARKELRLVKGALLVCEESVEADRPVELDEWHVFDDAGQVINVAYQARV